MKVVVMKCPRILSPLLRLFFHMKRDENWTKAVLQNARQLLFYFRPAENFVWKKKAGDSAFGIGSKKDLPQFLFYIPKKLIYNGDGEM